MKSQRQIREAKIQYKENAGTILDKPVKTPQEAFEFFVDTFGHPIQEHFVVISVDSHNVPISYYCASVGTTNAANVDTRDILRYMILSGGSACILMHNHPVSGSPQPSDDDNYCTTAIVKHLTSLGFKVLDHVVVGRNKYYSYVENSKL